MININIQWIMGAIFIGLVYAGLAVLMLVVMIVYHIRMRNDHKRMIKLREKFEVFLDSLEQGEITRKQKKKFSTRQLLRLVPYFRAIPDKKKHQLAIEYFIQKGLVKVLAKKMRFSSRSKRVQIIETLALFPDKTAQKVLHDGLKDVSKKVRLASAIALMENDAPWWLYDVVSSLPNSKTDVSNYLRPDVENESRVEKLANVASLTVMPPLMRCDAINILAQNAGVETVSLAMTQKINIASENNLPTSKEYKEPIFKIPEDDKADDRYSEIVSLNDEEIDIEQFNRVFANLLDDDALPVLYAAGKALLKTGDRGHKILEHTKQNGSARAKRAAAFFLRSEKIE
ncbi:HEAT repeat domain-containing protein [uncultured Bartonella sp.]|uniref:HEAT repeat domain-containing protein n=1 Tax=uncultured Bartonella sp. TaxID=104108 RepID=UPI0025ED5293|nr:HEAT repeat domain-containing protein [uncultured Bartonella sp.]